MTAILLVPITLAAKKKPAAPEAHTVISGSVFREDGYALPGAKVVLTPMATPHEGSDKPEKMGTVSSPRGEFAFRVPPGPMTYTVSITAQGYHGAQKTVSVEGLEREDVTFRMEPESK